jgi:hypothetical protein
VSATPLYCSSSDSFCSLIVMHSPLALLSTGTARGLEPPSAVFTVSTPNPQVSRGNQSQSGGPESSQCPLTPLYCSSSDSFCSLIVMHSPLALLSTARGLEPPSAVFTVSTPNPQVSRGNQSQSGGPVSSDCAEGHHGAAGVLRECVRWGYIIIYVLQHP